MKSLTIFFLLFTSHVFAISTSHEWDIAGAPGIFINGSTDLRADTVETTRSSNAETKISLYLEKNGKRNIIKEIQVPKSQKCTEGFESIFKLDHSNFKVQDDWNKGYSFKINAKCAHLNKFIFQHDSFSGQAMGIYLIAKTAVDKFQKIDRLNFWQKKIKLIYPGDGDYYSYNTVNVTRGHYWDVVGHEIGHAIYDQADIGQMGGGFHRIDECYTSKLALSEGWASFFSAWLSVSLDDPDAKFEYMVARRAPLEIEHVPADVCRGPNNEWRVYTFLWDIIDRNQDNENMSKLFQNLWDKTLNKRFASIDDLKSSLENNGFDPVLLNILYAQNILGE